MKMASEILGIKLIYDQAVAIVAGAALFVSLGSSLVHRKLVNRKQMDEIRKKVEAHQKEFIDAQKRNDQKAIARLEAEQEHIMGLVKQNMMSSMKPVLITMPPLLIIFWALSDTYAKLGPIMDLPFGIPFLTYAKPELGVVNGMDWFGLYLIIALATGLGIEFIARKLTK
jgi:uncharacterized membrane protein (DUF106 family)